MVNSKTSIRTLVLLEIIAEKKGGLSFSEIQQRSQMPKSSLHTLLKELHDSNYLEYNNNSKKYFAGTRLIKLASTSLSNMDILENIKIEMEKICEETGETIHVGVLSDRFVSYVLKLDGKESSSIANVGLKLPAHCTGVGKVLLSSLSNEQLKNMLENVELEKYTQNTITSIEKLIPVIDEVRKNHYAIENGEISVTISCVAVPIYINSKLALAISISIPNYKFNDTYIEKLLSILNSTRDKIEKKFETIGL
ncbi:IclR family transcriptional regulator [Fusobacterium sp. PH5-44]|uniref:IclR family transcriptional regulator n=1 Tax=unclassified Fusobacterium TaxID=2648384 RepID=UPI003D25C5DE